METSFGVYMFEEVLMGNLVWLLRLIWSGLGNVLMGFVCFRRFGCDVGDYLVQRT